MHPDDLLDALQREGDELATVLRDHDLSVDVPTCPGWTLETIANHCGRIHRWATATVRTRATERVDFPPRPERVDAEWFEEGLTELVAALREAGPESPCWNFMGQPPEARFWMRRQAHETSIHRWDAQAAVAAPAAIDTELAIDGIDELLDVILPLGYKGDDLGGTVHLHATDSPHGEWLIRTIDGELLVGHDHAKGDAAVRGTAESLLLWLWGRVAVDDESRFEAFGDRPLVARLREVLRSP